MKNIDYKGDEYHINEEYKRLYIEWGLKGKGACTV